MILLQSAWVGGKTEAVCNNRRPILLQAYVLVHVLLLKGVGLFVFEFSCMLSRNRSGYEYDEDTGK